LHLEINDGLAAGSNISLVIRFIITTAGAAAPISGNFG
jgi:hypothetical protein